MKVKTQSGFSTKKLGVHYCTTTPLGAMLTRSMARSPDTSPTSRQYDTMSLREGRQSGPLMPKGV